MTFGEKLTRLRKREGMSQEDLAAQVGVSRQAVSRWEQSTAMPDSARLWAVSRLFRVSADYLLDEELEQEEASAIRGQAEPGLEKHREWPRKLAGAITLAVSLLGMLLLGILSSVFPAAVSEAPVGEDWVRVYTGLTGFLKFHHLEWLLALCLLAAAWGAGMLLHSRLRRRTAGNEILQSNLTLLAICGQAGVLYSCAQALWWVRMRRQAYWPPFWISLALLLFCSVWMVRNLLRERDPAQRRKNSRIELLYCMAQLSVGLLTAEAGIGLVGMAANIVLCLAYLLIINPRYMNRRFTKS